MKTATVLLTATLLTTAGAARAVDSPAELARKTHTIFERRCAECHDQAGHGASKGGFGFVLDLARLAKDVKFVNQTAPQASNIYTRLTQSDPDRLMPKLTKADKARGLADPEPLPSGEQATILQWLENGAPALDGSGSGGVAAVTANPPPDPARPGSSVPAAPAPVAQRAVVREAEAMLELQRDFNAQPEQDRAQVRYLSLLPQQNNTVEVSNEQLEAMRSGVRKLLNSLSTNPKILQPAEVGPGKAFFRFKLDDLGWNAALWERIVSFYPYALQDSNLGGGARTEVPVLRADWLATNGTHPPLYHEILGLPKTLDELNRKLGVDLVGNLQELQALRAGFTASGISRYNRMIERHDLKAWPGYYWISYDFAGSNAERDLLRNPLGPVQARLAGGRRAFRHDGGEIIFSLPNGFQGYLLVDSQGARLDIAPTNIVGDTGGVTGRPDIVNGFSCIVCHSAGMKEQRGNKDSVTDLVRATAGRGGFTADEEEAILALYPEQKEIDAAIAGDRETFKAKLKEAKVTQGGTEPISLLALPYEERLTLARAAAELGLAAAALEQQLAERDDFGVLRVALGQSAEHRDAFSEKFAELVQKLRVGRARRAAPLTGTVVALRTEKEERRPKPLLFEMKTEKSVYRNGEPVNLAIFAEAEGHLRLFYKDAAGAVTTLFPTQQLIDDARARGAPLNDRIPGGRSVLVSGRGSATHITVFIEGPKFGREQLAAVLTDFPLEDDDAVRAEIEKSGSIEAAIAATTRAAAKSARARLNAGNAAARPRIGIQIVNLHTVEK